VRLYVSLFFAFGDVLGFNVNSVTNVCDVNLYARDFGDVGDVMEKLCFCRYLNGLGPNVVPKR
jgi:hypothetical protein